MYLSDKISLVLIPDNIHKKKIKKRRGTSFKFL